MPCVAFSMACRALEAHLGRLRQRGAAHVQSDVRQQLLLELGLELLHQVRLEPLLDAAQAFLAHDLLLARRGEDDQKGVPEARDGDELLLTQKATLRLYELLSYDAEDFVADLEPLDLLQPVHAVEAYVEDAQLRAVEELPLDLDLTLARGQAGDLVVVHRGVAQDVAHRLHEVLDTEEAFEMNADAPSGWPPSSGELHLGREEDDRDVCVAELQLAADLIAVHRHHHVEEDQVRVLGEGQLEAALAGVGREDLVALRLQDVADHVL
jgi:hypothetical protein